MLGQGELFSGKIHQILAMIGKDFISINNYQRKRIKHA
jgi:hypothetical protein